MDLTKNEIAKHITDVHHLAEKAIPDLRNEIKHIIQTQSTNKQGIENCLDRLLDFAFHPKALSLFKELCRYYLDIDPEATHQYVRFFKDMYENG
jgi:hypothetical protein